LPEAQRFLRYVVPGLTFFIELLIYLLISRDICFSQLIGMVNPIGIAISGFLASGSLGFLFGIIYYSVVWREKILTHILTGANLRRFLEYAERKEWLKLYCPTCLTRWEVKAANLTKRGAWRAVISYIDTREEDSKTMKGAVGGMKRLANLMNGLGTTCSASFAALITLIFFVIRDLIYAYQTKAFSWLLCLDALALAIGGIILWVHHVNYKGVVEDYENVVGAMLLSEFEHEHDENKHISDIKLYVSQNDLKKDWLKTDPSPDIGESAIEAHL